MPGSCPKAYQTRMRPAFFTRLLLGASVLFLAGGVARAQQVQPLDRLLPEIRRSHPGQIYEADGPNTAPDGSQHYHLKWMTPDGRIEWLDTDARTGRVLGSSPGRDTFDTPTRVPQPPPQPERMPDRFFPGNGQGFGPPGQMERDRPERGDRDQRDRGDPGRNFDGRFRER